MGIIFDSYCGLECNSCEYRETSNCGGCIKTNGKPFHGECEIAECAKAKKKRFCGECEDFPCEIIVRYSNDKEHGGDSYNATLKKAVESGIDYPKMFDE